MRDRGGVWESSRVLTSVSHGVQQDGENNMRDRSRATVRDFLVVLAGGCWLTMCGAPLLQNGDFSETVGGDAARPVAWSVPAGSPWHGTNEDGHSGQDGLRYRAPGAAVAGPVRQQADAVPGGEYVLTASVKNDGRLRPMVRVMTAAEPVRELVRLAWSGPAGVWGRHVARFTCLEGQRVVVEVWADGRHVQGTAAPAGTVVFDDVQVLPAADAEALLTDQGPAGEYENVARGARYVFEPQPGYGHCTDAADKTQLTDGQYTAGYFWTQKSTVGWSGCRPVIITLDLGKHVPIRGISYNTAAGVAGVEWPGTLMVLVSVDGRAYHSLGDLVALTHAQGDAPAEEGYAVHRFHAEGMKAHGRYVKLLIDPVGPYCFVDEIEVYRGDDAWLQLALPGEEIRHPLEYFEDDLFQAAVKRQLGYDLEEGRMAVKTAQLPETERQRLGAVIGEIEQAIGEIPTVDSKGFRAVFPLNDVHARTFSLHGAVRAARGLPPLVAWKANCWDPLGLTELADPPPAPSVALVAMRGETRAGAVNLTNCIERPITVQVRLTGLPPSANPGYISVHEVAWTHTREGKPVAAALPEAPLSDGGYTVSVPAGMTRQVWLSVTPRDVAGGTYRGAVVVSWAGGQPLTVPLSLRVLDLDFPDEPSLSVGGWDYTDVSRMYGVTPENREALIAHLQERYVDSPWATSGVLAVGTFDGEGTYTQEPDTGRFDAWVDLWQGARRYCVFAAVRDSIAGTKIGEPLFDKKVAAWIRFWVKHARTREIQPGQLYLLLVDEPHDNNQDQTIVAWARAIKAVEPDVVIWEDPTYSDPTEATAELMAASDMLCPNRPMILREGEAFEQFYRDQHRAGKRLDLYSCSGPSRMLDPYSYHRLQAWDCFDMGAEGTFFWAFGDTGGGSSWNEYLTQRRSFTPLFLGPASVTAGKHMEAIRESVQDFEYLTMLRKRVGELEGGGQASPYLVQAKQLLTDAVKRVMSAEGATELDWLEEKDRSVADTVRIEIGTMLERLR